jgi:hypothetical protein
MSFRSVYIRVYLRLSVFRFFQAVCGDRPAAPDFRRLKQPAPLTLDQFAHIGTGSGDAEQDRFLD